MNCIKEITGHINGQRLTLDQPVIVGETIDYLTATFDFDARWDGTEKFVHFSHGEDSGYVLLNDDKITEDQHLNLGSGLWQVWIIGERTEGGEVVQRITTQVQTLRVEKSGVTDGEPFPEDTGSAGEQIVAQAIAAKAAAEAAQTAAEASETAAGEYAGAAASSAAGAASSAALAADRATAAAAAALNASANADLASAAKDAAIESMTAAEGHAENAEGSASLAAGQAAAAAQSADDALGSARDAEAAAERIEDKTGDLDDLITPSKDNLVNAINDAYNHGGGADLPETTNLLKGDGDGGAVAATPGTDYATKEQVDEKAWVDESEDYGEVFNPISAQATPLVANSVSEMTNTNRFYVLVNNQHIYYHNGTTWVDSTMVYSGGFIALINSKSDFDSFINGNDYIAFVSDVSITSPVTIPSAKKCEHKRIIGGTIRLSSNLFTWSNAGTPTNLPHFDSCVFVGNGYNVAPNGAYATNGHFANCSFLDCGLVSSGAFAQSQRFVNCRIAMNANHPFILANCVYECRFIACQCESDNKSQLVYATNTNASLRSVSHTTIADSIFEGQTTEVIRMKDGSVYLNDIYTANIKQFIKVEESPMSSNPIIKIVCKNCGFISDASSVIFDIDESYSGSTRTEISITDTSISVGKLISELEYRKYYLKNISADSGGNFMPSNELSKIGGNKNSVADFTTTGHCIVKKFPCLITFDSNDGTRHTNLYFVSLAGTNPSVVCLSDPTKTPTITYDSTTGHCDITLHANRYTQSNTSAVLLDGIDNALIRNGYYRATDGYDA